MKTDIFDHYLKKEWRRRDRQVKDSCGSTFKSVQATKLDDEKLDSVRMSDKEEQIHKVNLTLPIFKMKKQNSQNHTLKTQYSIDKNSGVKMTNSNRKSSERHKLKPCQVPIAPKTTEFISEKTVSEAKVKNQSQQEEQVPKRMCQTSQKIVSNRTTQSSNLKKTVNLTFVRRQYCSGKSHCHSQIHNFMQQIQSKMEILTKRMTAIEDKNHEVRLKIQQKNQQNNEKASNLMRLIEEKQELLQTKQKWENGKQKLQELFSQISQKLMKQKNKEKQNMSRKQCQKYFNSQQKVIKTSPPHLKKVKKSKKNILQQFQLRVHKI